MHALGSDDAIAALSIARADDALVLGHRLSEWCGHGPTPEEDMALANIGLDLIGHARSLYQYAAERLGGGASEDSLAYLRDAPAYRNLLLAEVPNGDFARTMLRLFLYAAFADVYWRATMRAGDERLAAIAAKAEKETAYHVRHTAEWVIRLGDGTAESHRRAQAALDELWPYTGEMFEADDGETAAVAAGLAIHPASLRAEWDGMVGHVLAEATLERPKDGWMQRGGRAGRHTEHLARLLAEMQVLQRTHPGATW